MAGTTNFPGSVDDFAANTSTPTSTTTSTTDSTGRTHSKRHDDMEAAMEAVQAVLQPGAGAWTSYTPTLTGFTLGNGTVSGKWSRIGNTVFYRASFTFGSTSAAAADFCVLTLPATAASTDFGQQHIAHARDVSPGNTYIVGTHMPSTGTVRIGLLTTTGPGLLNAFSTTAPFTWATGDIVYLSGTYEAA